MALLDRPAGVRAPFLEGVGARFGCLRKGDSGRGKDGVLALKLGLEARAPGPSDCENLGMEGVSGPKFGLSVVEVLKLTLLLL